MEGEGDFDKGYDSSVGDDDKTFAAMGVAKTIGTVNIFLVLNLGLFISLLNPQIISSVDTAPEILSQVEEIVTPIIIFTLEHKLIGKLTRRKFPV